jgi:hypothetical protein
VQSGATEGAVAGKGAPAGLHGGDGLVRGILGNLADVESTVLHVLPLPTLGRASRTRCGLCGHVPRDRASRR